MRILFRRLVDFPEDSALIAPLEVKLEARSIRYRKGAYVERGPRAADDQKFVRVLVFYSDLEIAKSLLLEVMAKAAQVSAPRGP